MKLLPCKKCGSKNMFRTVAERHKVKCGGCGYSTRAFKTPEFAAADWNDREMSDQINDLLDKIIECSHPDDDETIQPQSWDWIEIVTLARKIKGQNHAS